MLKLARLTMLALVAPLGGCGAGNDITTTNDNNVVLNDHQSNYASTNDGEMPANDSAGLMPQPAVDQNASSAGNVTGTP